MSKLSNTTNVRKSDSPEITELDRMVNFLRAKDVTGIHKDAMDLHIENVGEYLDNVIRVLDEEYLYDFFDLKVLQKYIRNNPRQKVSIFIRNAIDNKEKIIFTPILKRDDDNIVILFGNVENLYDMSLKEEEIVSYFNDYLPQYILDIINNFNNEEKIRLDDEDSADQDCDEVFEKIDVIYALYEKLLEWYADVANEFYVAFGEKNRYFPSMDSYIDSRKLILKENYRVEESVKQLPFPQGFGKIHYPEYKSFRTSGGTINLRGMPQSKINEYIQAGLEKFLDEYEGILVGNRALIIDYGAVFLINPTIPAPAEIKLLVHQNNYEHFIQHLFERGWIIDFEEDNDGVWRPREFIYEAVFINDDVPFNLRVVKSTIRDNGILEELSSVGADSAIYNPCRRVGKLATPKHIREAIETKKLELIPSLYDLYLGKYDIAFTPRVLSLVKFYRDRGFEVEIDGVMSLGNLNTEKLNEQIENLGYEKELRKNVPNLTEHKFEMSPSGDFLPVPKHQKLYSLMYNIYEITGKRIPKLENVARELWEIYRGYKEEGGIGSLYDDGKIDERVRDSLAYEPFVSPDFWKETKIRTVADSNYFEKFA